MSYPIDNKTDFFGCGLGEETVAYTPDGGSAVNIDAFVDESAEAQEPYVRGTEFAIARLEVHSDDVGTVNVGDTFTFRGYEWVVVTASRAGSWWSVTVERDDSTAS